MTRLNVYAGTAGMYVLRSTDPADNPTVSGSGAPAVLRSGAYEIPLVVQDRSFNVDGSLFYPSGRTFFDGFAGPYAPDSDVPPMWNPEFFGNCMVVNGRTWPYLEVERRRYRFRVLNACSARFLRLSLRLPNGSAAPGVQVWQLGADGGFLRAPVLAGELLMAPAERADIVIDFTAVPDGTSITMVNRAPDAPYNGGGAKVADATTTGQVMQFRVGKPLQGSDPSTAPTALVMPAVPAGPAPTVTRTVATLEEMTMTPGLPPMPVQASLGRFDPNVGLPAGVTFQAWSDPVTENPAVGATEVWELYNFTEDAHPIHVHATLFQVVDRQRLDTATGRPDPKAKLRPPEPGENGLKDTVIAYPGDVTRLRMTFKQGGQYTWHCHIIEHEDNEMMRPYRVGPPQVGEPMPNHHGGM